MKKIITSILSVGVLTLSVGALATTLVGCGKDSGPDLQALYDEYCDPDYSWASVGEDGSYLTIDTNPFDLDDDDDFYGILTYNSEGTSAIKNINAELGLPESLYNDMQRTTSAMGQQSENYSDIGITVTWTYHPDKGLVVTYKKSHE